MPGKRSATVVVSVGLLSVLAAFAMLCVGCSTPPRDYSGDFVPIIAVACGVAEVTGPAAPVPSGVCPACDGKGRLPIRDTGRFEDCPDCDLDPPLTPLSTDAAEPQDAAVEPPAAVEWLSWPEAFALSKETGRPVLVLQRFRDPEQDAACLPCQRLKKTLADPDTLAAFAELGIPCLEYADAWQTGDLRAPAIAYVAADAKAADATPMLTGFRVAPRDAFLEDLTEWINALD